MTGEAAVPPSFDITAATNEVQLDANNAGKASFTVTNKTVNILRANLLVEPADGAQPGWFRIEGETLREFKVSAAEQVIVGIAVPPGTPAGTHSFRLDAIGEREPDEQKSEGQSVSFTIPEPKPRRAFPWWIALIALIVLIGIGVTIFLVTRGDGDGTPTPTPTVSPTVTPQPVEQPTRFSFEAEDILQSADNPDGKAVVQSSSCCPNVNWSGGQQLWFRATDAGDSIILRFEVPVTGYYRLTANLTKSFDYGKIDISIDGQNVAKVDVYNPSVISAESDLADLALTKGAHNLRFVMFGRNPASGGVFAGIDTLAFTPTRRIRFGDIRDIQRLKDRQEVVIGG